MDDKELLFSLTKKDFIIQPFKASGPGGQHRNKNATAIRIIHPDSGAKAECKEYKSQHQNKKEAFKRLVEAEEFKRWHRLKTAESLYGKQQIEEKVNKWMKSDNLKIEVWDGQQKRYVEMED